MSNFAASTLAPRTFTEREQAILLKVSGEHRDGFRDHVLIAMALATGLRQHELVALDVGDVFDADGDARRRIVLRVYKRSCHTPSIQEVVLPDRLRMKIERLLADKRRRGEPVVADAPLFLSRKGRRLSTRQARELVARWQAKAGLDRRLSFHALRHSACTNFYRRTKDIRLTQRFARHESLSSTQGYTHASDEELVRAVGTLPC